MILQTNISKLIYRLSRYSTIGNDTILDSIQQNH